MEGNVKKKEYYETIKVVAIPVILQNLLTSSLGAIDLFMVTRLGDASVAGIGFSNRLFLILISVINGIASGGAIFAAQYHGQKNNLMIQKVMKLCAIVSIGISLIFVVASTIFSKNIIGLYSDDQVATMQGATYVRVVCWAYLCTALISVLSSILRSIKSAKVPLYASITAVLTNTLLNFLFVYGIISRHTERVEWIAAATVISKLIELMILVVYIFSDGSILRCNYFGLDVDLSIMVKILKKVGPLILNTFLWSLGQTFYTGVMGKVGTESVAAYNVAQTIESLAFTIFSGLACAGNVLVGHLIGNDEKDEAYDVSGKLIVVCIAGGILIGGIMIVIAPIVFGMYKHLKPDTRVMAINIVRIMGLLFWIKVTNMFIIQGVLRAGGDVVYTLIQSMVAMWCIGVPFTLIVANVFHVGIYIVLICTFAEEVVKLIASYIRYRKKKWIVNVTKNESWE
ncbi:MAG TPA: hypothetical protein DCW90_23220 [Lachnospiraceae bacterium]|nr:MATE family efflux transporter [uncultured Lachnoclostridium sp.]HAU88278.1 hypothetical protein [Lachnospiraceae bacterium]